MPEPTRVVLLLTSATAAYVLIWIIRAAAGRYLLDHPNARSSHDQPTPRGAGIAIVLVSLAVALVVLPWPVASGYAVAAGSVAIVSLLDDVRSVPWRIRLAVHSAAALVVIFTIAAPLVSRSGQSVHAAAAIYLLIFCWIVGLTNAYNFMDGIDGIAGLQAIVAGVALFLLLQATAIGFAQVALAIAASSAGFLLHNLPRARIFLGDVGSAFLGFSFASIAVVGAAESAAVALAAPLVVWPFVFDASFTFMGRALRGERVYEPHRSHIYQRLVQTGLSHLAVSLIYGALAAAGALCAIAISRGLWSLALIDASLILISIPALWIFLRRRETPR